VIMNVAINDHIARLVKREMDGAVIVNQDIGVTTVKINVVLGVQGIVRSRTECVCHACPGFGETHVIIYVTLNHAVNNVLA